MRCTRRKTVTGPYGKLAELAHSRFVASRVAQAGSEHVVGAGGCGQSVLGVPAPGVDPTDFGEL